MTIIMDIEYLDRYKELNLPELEFQHDGDACFDLRTTQTLEFSTGPNGLNHGPVQKAHTGIKVHIPEGTVMLIMPRSGLHKLGVTMANNIGVIDPNYRGEIIIPLIKFDHSDTVITEGQRIVQALVIPLPGMILRTVDKVDPGTERGEGGFGSTGNF